MARQTYCEETHCQMFEHTKKQVRSDAIDECVKILAKSEDTILSDRQYYTLMKLKEQK